MVAHHSSRRSAKPLLSLCPYLDWISVAPPRIRQRLGMLDGCASHQIFDPGRCALQWSSVDQERRVPGSPTFDGYQYRFRSNTGYNYYLADQLVLAGAGIQRGFNDYYNALVREGIIEAPPNCIRKFDKVIVNRINSEWKNNLLYNVTAPDNAKWFLSDFHFLAAMNDLAGNNKVAGGRAATATGGACKFYSKFAVNL